MTTNTIDENPFALLRQYEELQSKAELYGFRPCGLDESLDHYREALHDFIVQEARRFYAKQK